MATTSTTDRLVIAGPSSLLQPSSSSSSASPSPKQFLLLPHPRTGLPAYFLPSASTSSPASPSSPTAEEYDEIYELQSAKSERKARSWFLGGSRGEGEAAGQGNVEGESSEARGLAGDKGWVIQDPSLHLLSRVDPAFLLLPMLDVLLPSPTAKTSTPQSTSASSTLLADSGSYLPREDLFESVAATMYRRLTETHGKIAGKGAAATLPPSGTDEEGSWVDISAFGQLALARGALARLCSTQEASTTTSTTAQAQRQGQAEQYFRPSPRRIVSFLRSKVVALSSAETFRSHPATLGRMLDRAVDDPLMAIKRANGSLPVKGGREEDGEGDVKTRRVRTELALELVRAYVPVGRRVEELFEGVVKAGLMRELDEEEVKREDHERREVGDEVAVEDADLEAEAEAALREQEVESGRL